MTHIRIVVATPVLVIGWLLVELAYWMIGEQGLKIVAEPEQVSNSDA